MKTGQSTLFIILGLLLVIFIGLFFYGITQTRESSTVVLIESDSSPVTSFIDQCFEDVSTKAIIETSLQGGYFYAPSSSTDQILAKIPYYVDRGVIDTPSIETIEENIANYITTMMPFCINNFKNIEGATIIADTMDVEVQLNENILITLNYPVQVEGELLSTTLSAPYTKEFSIDFTYVYSIIETIVQEHNQSPDFVPIGVLSAASYNQNFSSQLSYLPDSVVIYSLTFPEYEIDYNPYVFLFAAHYNWSDLDGDWTEQQTAEIEPIITDTICYAGDPCYHTLNIYHEPFIFTDNTDLFDITEDGEISFIPSEKDIGIHNVAIKVENPTGKIKYYTFSITIEGEENEA